MVTHAGVDLGDLPDRASVRRIDIPRGLVLGHDIDKPRNLAKSVTVE